MQTIKLVVVGDSGVGKTSLRGQYISGRFSTGYRATIGADFIAKTVPHPHIPDESVTLQIWDTAGQERFSSLSSAFFRGADAVLLIFDVNKPSTLTSLTRWWDEFRAKAPVPDEEAADFCCVVVGNKMDLARPGSSINHNAATQTAADGYINSIVTELEAMRFLDTLIPPDSHPPSPISDHDSIISHDEPLTDREAFPHPLSNSSPLPHPRSIAISSKSKSLSRSHSRSATSMIGTVRTTRTTVTIYHTPSSSLSLSLHDHFSSARSSPRASYYSRAHSRSRSRTRSSSLSSLEMSPTRTPRRMASLSMSTTSDAPTVAPRRPYSSTSTTPSTTNPYPHAHSLPSLALASLPPRAPRGPKLFFASAKTGDGVPDVFAYVAQRVLARWAYEAALDARTLHVRDRSGLDSDDVDGGGTIRLDARGRGGRRRAKGWKVPGADTCCAS
ncbi:ras-domain-containing protein [Punctularia strigosozonata HHB-11173 SS5]|uniref:ras-domain-containing protein n=1 Tax=Punctularia strigosozonata (strain HHB-11173) TaxID=741275 RepID=UPI000441782A|nr:ras-domain-containing protein [Punctularia strigosozonata HHB-11173 SS5]EIN13095.1 ras-domain-containing protein [Punctularia strigosozonata HHB-11173 SS5]